MRIGVSTLAILCLSLTSAGPISAGVGDCGGDCDGIPDSADNCVLVPNGPAQAPNDQCDADHDGYGNICDADLDNSGAVGPADFGLFQMAWGQTGPNPADFDCSGAVGPADFGYFQMMWGTAPGPSGLSCAGTIPCP